VRKTAVDRQTIIRDSLYTVQAEETITVSAGSFRTLKIVWRNKKTNAIFYEMSYAPDVKLWVKIREFLSNGIRERELIGFKVNQTQSATPTAEPDVIGPSAASASPSAKPVIRRGITKVSGNDPAFPRAAIRAGIERGHVVSRVQVDETGNVDEVTIIKADPPDHFDQAVIEALKEWKFQGDGNRWVGEIEINFELKDSVAQEAAKSQGQPIPPLPTKLTGAILSQTTQFVPLSDGLELQISSQDSDGKVAGLFSRAVRYQNPGQQCMRADNMHSDGIYDGKKLVLTVRYSQSVSICNDVTLTFYRGKEHYFHTLAKDGSWSMYLDPVK